MDKETYDAYVSFVNYYIHQVNMMRHLLGEDYKVTYADPSGAMLAVTSESGVAGVIEMSPYQNTIDWQEEMFVCFEKGWIKVNLPAPMALNRPGTVEIYKDPGDGAVPERLSPQLPWIHAMRQQAINFVKAVKGEMKPLCEAKDAYKDLQVARDYIRMMRGK
jgi:predicted dehydrogenase